jgi:hypothetical protein
MFLFFYNKSNFFYVILFKKKNSILKIFNFLIFNYLLKIKKKKIYFSTNIKKNIIFKSNIFLHFFKNYSKNFLIQKHIDIKKKNFFFIFKFRNNFNTLFFKKKKYKKNYFNYIKGIKNIINCHTLLKKLLNVQNILIKLNFFFNYSDFYFFLKNKFIFKNKTVLFKNKPNLKLNDIIELIYVKNFLSFQNKICFFINKFRNVNFLKKKINFKIKHNKYNFSIKKIKMDFYSKNEFFSLFELDFFSLTFIFLKNNFSIFYINTKLEKKLNIFYINFLK